MRVSGKSFERLILTASSLVLIFTGRVTTRRRQIEIYVDELQSVVDRTMNRRKPQNPATNPPTTPPSTTPPMQSFLAPSLAAKAAAKAQIDPDDDEILDLIHEIAMDPKK